MSEISIATKEESFVETAENAPSGVRIPVEVRLTVSDPFAAYRRVRDNDNNGFYLETTGGQPGWGYFGVDPIERLQVHANAVSRCGETPAIGAIDALLEREQLIRGGCEVPYPCGAFGWLSYDVARDLEDISQATDERLPRLQLGVFDRVAAWKGPVDDKVTLHITASPIVDDPDAAYARGRKRAHSMARMALHGNGCVSTQPTTHNQTTFESECGKDRFADRVRTVQQYIRDGETFQANISHRLVPLQP